MNLEVIETPEFVFMKMGENWTKNPMEPSMKENSGIMDQEEMNELLSTGNIKLIGKDKVGNINCIAYEQEIEGLKTNIYVSTKNNLPQKIVSEIEGGGTVTVLYDFNSKVKIKLPEVKVNTGIPMMPDMGTALDLSPEGLDIEALLDEVE
jgi:hypothetical protein